MLAKGEEAHPGDRVLPEEEIKDPFVLEFLDLKDEYSESDLEEALIRQLETFLMELGDDFCFIGRQRRLRVGGQWYRVDLLFFHRGLQCLVVIDLKIGGFTHADAGQMHLYLNYAREHWVHGNENPPVGLILCSEKDEAVARYALEGLPNQVLAAEYRTTLPDEELLAAELDRTRRAVGVRGSIGPGRSRHGGGLPIAARQNRRVATRCGPHGTRGGHSKMNDYEPVDIGNVCNAGPSLLGGEEVETGPRSFLGLPFLIGGGGAGESCFVAMGGSGGAVTVPIGAAARGLVFVHRLLKSEVSKGGPLGVDIADYVFRYDDGSEERVRIRERFEIGSIPGKDDIPGVPGTPFLAVPGPGPRAV